MNDDAPIPARRPSWLAVCVCLLVRGYQVVLRPVLPPVCRFTPSCSQYMIEAVRRHGTCKGLWLGVCRICRCNPWHSGGYDPVP